MATKKTGTAGETGATGSTTPRKTGTTANKQSAATPDGATKKQASNGPTKKQAGATAKKTTPKTAAKTGTKTATKSAAKSTKPAGGGRGKADLRSDLREFVRQNPEGWGHDEWTGLVGQLRERGHKGSEEQLGSALERERLAMKLEEVEGLGPQRVKTLVDRFGTLYSLRHADADEVAKEAKIPRELAEKITRKLR